MEQTLNSIPKLDVQTQNNSQLIYSARKSKQQSCFKKYFGNSLIQKKNNKTCTKKLFQDESKDVQPIKRDSLGLLPESCYEDDISLLSPRHDTFMELQSNAMSILNTPSAIPNDQFHLSLSKHSLEKVCKGREICEKLSQLLHTHNRQIIWNMFQNLDENLHIFIVKNLVIDQEKKQV